MGLVGVRRWTFTVPGRPVGINASTRYDSRSGRHYTAAIVTQWRDDAARLAKAAGVPYRPDRHWAVVAVLYHETPNGPIDVDGNQKILLDSLQGVAYKTDRQVWAQASRRVFDPDHPRLVVTLILSDRPYPAKAPKKRRTP